MILVSLKTPPGTEPIPSLSDAITIQDCPQAPRRFLGLITIHRKHHSQFFTFVVTHLTAGVCASPWLWFYPLFRDSVTRFSPRIEAV